MAEWREFLKQHRTNTRTDVSFAVGLLIELAGTAVEKLDELKEIIMTSSEVNQASLAAEATAVAKLDADFKNYIATLTTAFNNVVAAWDAAKTNGLSSADLDAAIATAQSDISALPAVTDPTQPAPATPPADNPPAAS